MGYEKLYDERALKQIMEVTALCIRDLLEKKPELSNDKEILDFIDTSAASIIEEALDKD